MIDKQAVTFHKIGSNDVLDYISKAKKRIIFAKPAFLGSEIEALLKVRENHNINIDLYMEPGDKAIRLGFGDKEALDLINKKGSCFNIQFADRIRMAILCVDETALLYAPNLSFAEAETLKSTFANGILCNESVSKDLIKQFPILEDEAPAKANDNVIILPGGYIPDDTIIKLQNNIKNTITNTIKSLDANPAVDPSQLQKISVYRNNYKIVRQQINGIKIENKTINLKSFYKLIPGQVDQLRSSWIVFKREDIGALGDTISFKQQLSKLEEKYSDSLLNVGRFGMLLNIKSKAQYIEEVNKLRNDFKAYWGPEPSKEVIDRFTIKGSKTKKKSLKEVLDASRISLEEYLISLCPETKDFQYMMLHHYRFLKGHDNGNIKSLIKEFVHIFVIDGLKFPDVDDFINTIDIKLDFYDISDELLKDEDFNKVIERYELRPRQTSFGFESVW